MNRFRKAVLVGAFLNVLLLLTFPPYDVAVMGRSLPMFDAFYPVFDVPANRSLNGDLLYIVMLAVLVNALLAWLMLGRAPGRAERTLLPPAYVVIILGALNLVAALLFPPMEAFPFAQRVTVGTFDGFYFAFGDKSRRAIVVPLLYMEVMYILVNACAYWLAMSVLERRGESGGGDVGALTMLDQAALLRERAEAKLGATGSHSLLERGPERRHRGAGYGGPERRRHGERRHGER